jgi:tRNA threonylcarbamoyl adenosine modification protein YeaZ
MLICIDPCFNPSISAIDSDKNVVATMAFGASKQKGFDLVPFFIQFLEDSKIRQEDISAISIYKGPGPYTGLRMGSSFVKGYGMATGIPIIAIDVLDAIYFEAIRRLQSNKKSAVVFIEGGPEHFYYRMYHPDSTENALIFHHISNEGIEDLLIENEAIEMIIGPVGQIDHRHIEIIPNAEVLLGISHEYWIESRFTTIESFNPIYFKEPRVTVSKKLLTENQPLIY